MSPHPRIGKLDDRIEAFSQYGVKECWLMHQMSREIEVLKLQHHGDDRRKVYRGAETIESDVLRYFPVSVEVLQCW